MPTDVTLRIGRFLFSKRKSEGGFCRPADGRLSPSKEAQGVGGSGNPTLFARTSGAERQGGFCRPAGWPFVPLKGVLGLEGRGIRRCSLEQRRMAVVQLGEDALHGGFAEDG